MVFDSGDYYSMCEHHILPFFGKYYFAYIPSATGRILGISKVARVIGYCAAKMQLQERLAKEAVEMLTEALGGNCAGMALVMKGTHLCKSMRGVKNQGKMTVAYVSGVFERPEVKQEFLSTYKIARIGYMTKYCGKKVRECEEWIAEHGLMDYGGAQLQQYVKAMGIDDTTHRLWKNKHPEYVEALERGKDTFRLNHTEKLFNTLMEAAEGGFKESEEEHSEYRPGPDGKPQIVKMNRHKRKVYQKPDTVAAIFLMCNLDPTHWKQRRDDNVSFKKPDTDNDMSLDEIKEEIKRLSEE